MKQLDEIIYDAITADTDLMTAIGSRVVSTCFEVPPGEDDNTPIPNIIITDDGFQNSVGTKDTVWESGEDSVLVIVDVAAQSRNEVKALIKAVRRAIEAHIVSLYEQGEDTPVLEPGFPKSNGLAWDWEKPCYYQKLMYQCTTPSDTDNE